MTIVSVKFNGTSHLFASGLDRPGGLAFDSHGNLFEADSIGNIYEFTPSGIRSTFASGLTYPAGLAFDSHGDLFVADTHVDHLRIHAKRG